MYVQVWIRAPTFDKSPTPFYDRFQSCLPLLARRWPARTHGCRSSVPEPMDLSTPTPRVIPGGFTVGSYVKVDSQYNYNCGEQDSEGGLGYSNSAEGDETVSDA